MPYPITTLATLRPDLGGSVMEFDLLANTQRFIGLQVFPAMEVAQQAGTFGRVTIKSLLASIQTSRAPGAAYNRSKWDFTADSYATEENGVEQPVDDRQARMYRSYFDAELIATRRAQSIVLTSHEVRVATLVEANTNTQGVTGANKWSAHATAVPVTDVEAAIMALFSRGVIANTLAMTWEVYRNLRQCQQIMDRLEAAGAGQRAALSDIGINQLQAVFDLPNILIAGGQKLATGSSLSSLWDKTKVHVCRVAETEDIQEPALGRTFHWADDGSQIGTAVETYREENIRGEVVRARMDTDEKVIFSDAMQMITGVL